MFAMPGKDFTGLAALFIACALHPGRAAAQSVCADPKPGDFRKTMLTVPGFLHEPVELSVARDGRVFVAERAGRITVYDPLTAQVKVAATLQVADMGGDKGGLLSVAAGPTFLEDRWLYVLYAPRSLWNGNGSFAGGKFSYRLARFRVVEDKLDLPSEQVLLEYPQQVESHAAGSMIFGKQGNLYFSTGDNSRPSVSDQYSPMDEAPGHEYADDQRSTANTNDLRGKVIRIHPEPVLVDGRYYTIPEGNLFPGGMAKTRPEIYTMGHRNPYRIHADMITGRLFIGEFGPAALQNSDRGPAGADEITITETAGNMGYPYFIKDNQPYCHWDFASGKCVAIQGQTGMKYDPARPVNWSRNNTGLNVLPPAMPAAIWEHDGPNPDPVPGLDGCGIGAGPIYHFDPASDSKVKFPPWFEGKEWIYAINGAWQPKLMVIPPGPPAPIRQVVASPFNLAFSADIQDMEYGPDGSLFVADYDNNALFQVTYQGCMPPVSIHRANPGGGGGAASSSGRRRAVAGSAGMVIEEVYDAAGRMGWKLFRRDGNRAPAGAPPGAPSGVD
ncbi:MAG: cytochrome [Fibrobacteres bacterium]|nr:cytochrome [Fibrobacterota bacterium]